MQKLKPTNLYKYVMNIFNDDYKVIHFNTGIDYDNLGLILNNKLNLSAEDFFLVAKFISPDQINEMAEFVFEDYLNIFKNDEIHDESVSLFGKFLSRHIYSKGSLSEKTKMSIPIMTNLMKAETDVKSKLVAAELFLICKYTGSDFKETLEEIYPNCILMTEEQQKALEKEFKQNTNKAVENKAKESPNKNVSQEDFSIKDTDKK